MPHAGTVTEELRNDVRFALRFKVGKRQQPLTDVERDMVAAAICAIGRSSEARRGAGLRSWGGCLTRADGGHIIERSSPLTLGDSVA